MSNKNRFLGLLFALSLAALVILPFVGLTSISPVRILTGNSGEQTGQIFWQIRVPRVATGFLAGMMLSISGTAFQALFRNPLATPYTLGVSSGAALGAASYIAFGFGFAVFGIQGISLFAFAGACGVTMFVYGLTRFSGGFSTSTLLLTGVAVSLTASSLLLFVQYLMDLAGAFRIVHWLMGSVELVGFRKFLQLVPFAAIGIPVLALFPDEMNLITSGEDIARSRGVQTGFVKKLVFVAVSLMVGGVVAVCGPIGFVGLMVPHICRQFVGFDHRGLLLASSVGGGFFLVLCDTIARTIIAPAELPVGILTAMLGGGFFLWLLLSHGVEEEFY